MADSDLPSSWSHAGRIVLGNALWILPLLAGERLLDGSFVEAAGVTVAWFATIALAVKLNVIQELARNRQRHPQMLTWAFIIGGATLLALGIYRLSSLPDRAAAFPLAVSPPQTVSPPTTSSTPAFPARSASDADKEIPVLDAVFAIMRDAQPLEGEGLRLSGRYTEALQNDAATAKYDDELAAFRTALTGIYAKLLAIKDGSPQYFDDDISSIVDKVDFDSIRRSFDNFVGAWTALKLTVDTNKARPDDIDRLLSLHKQSFDKSMNIYHDWLYNSKEALLNRRKQLSAIAGRQQ
jgi:hypothetical protein